MKVTVIKAAAILKKSAHVPREVRTAMEDYTADLRAVSVSRTPYRKGNLESSSNSNVSGTTKVVGEVSFLATNKGYNYAAKMHDGNYKLGDKSKSKKAKRSKYSQKSFKVGKGYLKDTAKSCEKGYTKDLNERLGKLLD